LANIDSKENVSIPQEGSFTTIVGPPITIDFPGFVPITPAKIELKHQFALMPKIGRSFGKVTIYTGGGPALFDVEMKFINAVGFAVIGGTLVNVTGEPVSFSNDDWVWGGAARVGATYAIGPRWFLDLAYTFARSEEFKIKNAASFSNSNGPLTSSGVAFLNTREQITNQSVVLTLNRQF
jgi:opacity protein-like surface antigen